MICYVMLCTTMCISTQFASDVWPRTTHHPQDALLSSHGSRGSDRRVAALYAGAQEALEESGEAKGAGRISWRKTGEMGGS